MVAPRQPLRHNTNDIRIRFSHQNIRFSLGNLGKFDDPVALKHAQTICDRIGLDIASGNFAATNNAELALKYHPSAAYSYIKQAGKGIREALEEIKESPVKKAPTLVELLEKRLENKFSISEKSLISLLQQYGKAVNTTEDARSFINWIREERKLANSTLQRYLNSLRVISPYFKDIKVTVETKPMPRPFTVGEVKEIINWFENSKHYSHYADYVKFLFWTGARTGEAIGLQWKHIDFNGNSLFIYESLARKENSTSRGRRTTTKANKMREFSLANGLLQMLKRRYEQSNKNPEALVFPSPEGKAIDDHNFSQRIWKKCLQELKIEHRPQYNTRHTFISHFLEKTKDVVKCASLTHGSKSGIQTIYNNYAGIINRVEVPDFY